MRAGQYGGLWWVLAVVAGLVLAAPAGGQLRAEPRAFAGVDAQGDVTTLAAALRAMGEQADVVFAGTVVGVRRVDGTPGTLGASAGVVEVQFAVEAAVRGVAGTSYTLREWGGLWPAGEQRYRVGERRLMLLHRPGATGLSSPVAGMEGAIPVRAVQGRVGAGSTVAAGVTAMADLRWIAAKVTRPLPAGVVGGVATRAAAASARAAELAGQQAAAVSGEIESAGREPAREPVGMVLAARDAEQIGTVREDGGEERPALREMAGREVMALPLRGETGAGTAQTGSGGVLVHGVLPGLGRTAPGLRTDAATGPAMPLAQLLESLRGWAPPGAGRP